MTIYPSNAGKELLVLAFPGFMMGNRIVEIRLKRIAPTTTKWGCDAMGWLRCKCCKGCWPTNSGRGCFWKDWMKSDLKTRNCLISKTEKKEKEKRPAQKQPPGKGQNPWNSGPTPVARGKSGADAHPLAARQTVWLPA